MANVVFPFNRRGIFGIKSVGVPTITDTDVTFHFEAHPYVQMPYNGILIVNISTAVPTGTEGTLPVYFKTGDSPKVAVTMADGDPLTASDVLTTGYYLLFFDRGQNVLQVFNSVS